MHWFPGRIDDARFYERALTPGEIIELADPNSGPYPGAIMLVGSTGDAVKNNTVGSSGPAGISLVGASSVNLSGNSVFQGSTFGVYLFRSTQNTITGNAFTLNSGRGAALLTGSSGNLIYRNDFVENFGGANQGFDGAGPNRWNDTYAGGRGNFWGEWTAPDVNCGPNQANDTCSGPDGVVDNDYVIAGSAGSRDYYPLTTAVPVVPEFDASVVVIAAAIALALVAASTRLADRSGARRRKP